MLTKALKSLVIFQVLSTSIAHAAYFDTLPKGVRVFDYKNIMARNVNSSFNQTQQATPYSYSINLNAKLLSEIPQAAYYMNDLKAKSLNAYNMFSVGEYNVSAKADMNVQTFGLGYGINNKLTLYAGVPFYKAKVNINYNRSASNNYAQVAQALHNDGRDDLAGVYENVIENMFDFNASFFQSLVVDQYNYQPVGNWEGAGFGDMEIGAMYQVINHTYGGLAATLGVSLATGKVEDPSIIQDIGFGDGQNDVFFELGGGLYLSNRLVLNSFFRYTHQLADTRELRVPTNGSFTLSDQTGSFDFKLGDKLYYNINAEYSTSDWNTFRIGYELNTQDESKYDSQYTAANQILSQNTDILSHSVRLGHTFSTVNLFKKGKFMVPGSVDISYLHMMTGRNTAKADRLEIHFRMYF
jgi:hypothetical protein